MSKRLKYNSLCFIPTAYPLSEMDLETNQADFSDLCKEVRSLEDKLDLERNILEILHNLDDREKIIFLFQILRDDGYNIDHESCANVLHIQREWYMNSLSKVKQKIAFIIKKIQK